MAPDAAAAGSTGAWSRALVGGCALLLVGEPARADRLSQTVLGRHAGVAASPGARTRVLRELVRPRAEDFEPPWVAGVRVELRDAGTGASASPLLDALQTLPVEPRAALVLHAYAGLPVAEVAAVLATDPPTAQRWVDQAHGELASRRPDRWSTGRLAEELRSAAAAALVSGTPATDLAHHRQLARRRGLRGAGLGIAAALVVVLATVTGLDRGPEVPRAVGRQPVDAPGAPQPSALSPAPTPTRTGPAPVTALCDVRNPTCQATVMRRWRTTMSAVVAGHLDPADAYFTGYSFSYDQRYESRTFWAGGEGALALEVLRLDGGATEVYVQVASSDDTAIRCGAITGGSCGEQRSGDGDRFTLTTSTDLERGIEVQHRAGDDQVVTAVARNRTLGQVLDVTRADLVELVQDPRLRLPVI